MEVFNIESDPNNLFLFSSTFYEMICYYIHRILQSERSYLFPYSDTWEEYLSNPISIAPSEEKEFLIWPNVLSYTNSNSIPVGKRLEFYSAIAKNNYKLTENTLKERDDIMTKFGFLRDEVIYFALSECNLTIKEQFNMIENIAKEHGLSDEGLVIITDNVDNCEKWQRLSSNSDKKFTIFNLSLGKDCKENICMELALIEMARSAKLLIGGRYSSLFCLAELLRYPLPSINIQNSNTSREYEEIRPPIENAVKEKRYQNIVGNFKVTNYGDIWVISNFLNKETIETLRKDLTLFKDEWFVKAILPAMEKDRRKEHVRYEDPDRITAYRNYAKSKACRGEFSYSFYRTLTDDRHHKKCKCILCRLIDTVESKEFIESINEILGVKIAKFREHFLSKYETGDFLTTHHDAGNGDYTFILPLTSDWYLPWGGITHFLNENQNEILCSIAPNLGDLVLFRVKSDKTSHHFVSEVTGPKPRYAFTGWFEITK